MGTTLKVKIDSMVDYLDSIIVDEDDIVTIAHDTNVLFHGTAAEHKVWLKATIDDLYKPDDVWDVYIYNHDAKYMDAYKVSKST